MKQLTLLPLLVASALVAAAPARAQQAFQVGPTLGAALSTVALDQHPLNATTAMPWRGGFLAGATGVYRSKGHWGGLLAVLYTEQGYVQHQAYSSASYPYQTTDRVRLNYLRVPVQAMFSQRAGGQGFQAFAGPYVGVLLAGNRTHETSDAGGGSTNHGRVIVADSYTLPEQSPFVVGDVAYPQLDYNAYSRRFDVGVQGGLGYRLGNTLLQVAYTLGLRNLATTLVYPAGPAAYSSVAGEPYRTRGAQASLTYLLGAHQ